MERVEIGFIVLLVVASVCLSTATAQPQVIWQQFNGITYGDLDDNNVWVLVGETDVLVFATPVTVIADAKTNQLKAGSAPWKANWSELRIEENGGVEQVLDTSKRSAGSNADDSGNALIVGDARMLQPGAYVYRLYAKGYLLNPNVNNPTRIDVSGWLRLQIFDGSLIPLGPDCNLNNISDLDDIAGGASPDINENGIPDECETDSDGDNVMDARDVCPNTPPFVTSVNSWGRPVGDYDSDCDVDLNDFATFAANFTS
jgi:hypothetical protein